MMRWSVRPSEAGEASQTTGGPMIAGSSQVACTASGAESGVMPLRVAPPGSSRFTSMPVPARSAAMMWESASVAARDGPYGTETVRADLPEADGFGHEVRVHRAHADSGVVDQYVDAAEACQRAVDASGDGLLVADVHGEPGNPGVAGDPGGCFLDALPGPAGEDDAGTGFGQSLAHG